MTSTGGDSLSILDGTTSGGFTNARRFSVGDATHHRFQPSSVRLADVTGDGVLDAVVGHDHYVYGTNRYSSTISVLPGSGSGGGGGGAAPDIALAGANPLKPGSYKLIEDGDTTPSKSDSSDFGALDVSGAKKTNTFLIVNTGDVPLNLGSKRVEIIGRHASDFSIVQQAPGTFKPSTGSSFTIKFDPSAAGLRTAQVRIVSNDPDESPFDFRIQGEGEAEAVADLAITSTYIADSKGNRIDNPKPGDRVFVRVNFSGENLPTNADYRVWHKMNGQVLSNKVKWGAGQPGRSHYWHLWGAWTVQPGRNTVEVRLDADNTVAEGNEANNMRTFQFDAQSQQLPAQGVMISPSGKLSTKRPLFTWKDVARSDSYQLRVDKVDGPRRVINQRGLKGTSFQAVSNLKPGWYRVRVRAFNSAGKGQWSVKMKFKIRKNGFKGFSSSPTDSAGTAVQPINSSLDELFKDTNLFG